MGNWTHIERSSFADFVDASVARAAFVEPWQLTPADELFFRGSQLARALVLSHLSGRVVVNRKGEANPVASIAMTAEPPGPELDAVRAAAVRVLAQTTVIQAAGRVDASDIETTSSAGDVGAWPIVVGVCVVSLGTLGFLGYTIHEYAAVVDNQKQRDADMAKLKAIDAQALALVKQHTDREIAENRQLPMNDALKAALAATARAQEIIAQKQTVSEKSRGFFDDFSPTQIVVGAALGLGGLLWLQRGK